MDCEMKDPAASGANPPGESTDNTGAISLSSGDSILLGNKTLDVKLLMENVESTRKLLWSMETKVQEIAMLKKISIADCDATVKIIFPVRKSNLYKTSEIVNAVSAIVGRGELLGVGILDSFCRWNVQLKTKEAARNLIRQRKIRLEDGTLGTAMYMENREASIRICWLPLSFPNEKFVGFLNPYGDILELEDEYYMEPELRDLKNGAKQIRISLKEGIGIEDLPHRGEIDGVPLLCIVFGRQPRCLKCGQIGHIGRLCTQQKRKLVSYADKLKQTPPREKTFKEDVAIEEVFLPATDPHVTPVAAEPVPPLNPEKVYEEVAVPLLEELECLTSAAPRQEKEDCKMPEEISTEQKGSHSAKRPRTEKSDADTCNWADEPYDTDESSEVSYQAIGNRRVTACNTLEERIQAAKDRLTEGRRKLKDLLSRTKCDQTKSLMAGYLHTYSVENAVDCKQEVQRYEGPYSDFKHVPKTRKIAIKICLAYKEIRILLGYD